MICPLWAQCKVGAGGRLELSSEAQWAFSFLYTVFFFYCEHIQPLAKMRPRFSSMSAAEYPYTQTSVFTQLQNIHRYHSNSHRLPHLASVSNGWQSSVVALSLGRLGQGGKHIWSHRDEGDTFYSFRLVQVLCWGQGIGWHFPW